MERMSVLPAIWEGNTPVDSPHKVLVTPTLMFPLMLAKANNWINRRAAGDLGCHDPHCDVIVTEKRSNEHLFKISSVHFCMFFCRYGISGLDNKNLQQVHLALTLSTTYILPSFYADFMLYCLGCIFTLHDTIVLLLNICSMYLSEMAKIKLFNQSVCPIFTFLLRFVLSCLCYELLWDSCEIFIHYSDVVMSATISQITGVSIILSTVCSGVDQRKHQSSESLHRWPVDSPHKGPVTRKMSSFDDVMMDILHGLYPLRRQGLVGIGILIINLRLSSGCLWFRMGIRKPIRRRIFFSK